MDEALVCPNNDIGPNTAYYMTCVGPICALNVGNTTRLVKRLATPFACDQIITRSSFGISQKNKLKVCRLETTVCHAVELLTTELHENVRA